MNRISAFLFSSLLLGLPALAGDGDFVRQRFVVSDTNRFTCGSGSVSCLSPDRTRILAPYLASTNGFGECHDLVAIADIPVGSPELSASYDLCAAGDVFAGETVTNVLGFTPFLWKGCLRVFLDVNYSRFGYRDWDPSARKVVGEGIFKCRTGEDAPAEPLTPAAISRFLTDLGLTGFDPCKERGDRCIFQSKPQWIGNAFYGFVTSSCSQPILFRCADGETFEFIGAIPTICAYECQLAALDGVFYAVMRGANGDNFWTSADGGRTWRPNGRLPDGLQRPQMLTWRNQVLIGYSAPDERPCRIRNGRNNFHLLVGEGTDLSRYREILHAADPIGIVYPDIVDIDGALHLLWSNSERFPTHVKWGAVQGKDQILYGRLSLFREDRSVMSDQYWKIWNDEALAKIDADIEKYRKADATVEVDAPDGTEVSVTQISHDFFFGAHIFNFNQLGKKEWNSLYKELYGTLFNSATVAFYWRTLEPYAGAVRFEERYEDTEGFWNACSRPAEQAHWRRPPPDPVIDFLKTRGCRIHGHPLVWGNTAWHRPTWIWDDYCPAAEKFALEQKTGVKIKVNNWRIPVGTKDVIDNESDWETCWKRVFKKLSAEEIAKTVPTFVNAYDDFYERRIRAIAERYGRRVDSWDVVNESANDFRLYQGGKSVCGTPCQCSVYGFMPGDYAYRGFKWAERYLPKTAWLNLNECVMGESFVRQAKDLEANGCRIDVVGSQMHLFDPAESVRIARGEGPEHLRPEKIAERFRLVSQTGKPIHLSEVTVTAPDRSLRGQMVQAIILRNLYRAWFSVERMNGITWWNVVDDCGAPGEPSISGLFTRDMRPKESYFAMDDLVNREWKTQARVKVRAEGGVGKISFRGFRGKYRLRWRTPQGALAERLVEVK